MKITKTGSCKKGGLCVGISLKGILHCIVYRNTIKVSYFSLCLSLTLAYLPQDSFQNECSVVTLYATTFNMQTFCVLCAHCMCVSCTHLRTNSDYFTICH